MRDLGTFGAEHSAAVSIDDQGRILANVIDRSDRRYAVFVDGSIYWCISICTYWSGPTSPFLSHRRLSSTEPRGHCVWASRTTGTHNRHPGHCIGVLVDTTIGW